MKSRHALALRVAKNVFNSFLEVVLHSKDITDVSEVNEGLFIKH